METFHLEKANGTAKENVEYCSKQGKVFTKGVMNENGKKRVDMVKAVNQVIEGVPTSALVEEHGAGFIMQRKKIMDVAWAIKRENAKQKELERYKAIELREWQVEVIKQLMEQNDREILFVIDPEGGYGKTFLTAYLAAVEGAFTCENGRSADIKYSYMKHDNVNMLVVFDLTKSSEDHINYEIIELLKNGRFTNTKYESQQVVGSPNKVVVFTNTHLDFTKFSSDRIVIIPLEKFNKADGKKIL